MTANHTSPAGHWLIRIGNLKEHPKNITNQMIEHRFNAYPVLVEALQAAERLYQNGVLLTHAEEYERVHTLRRKALEKAGAL